MSDLYGQEFFAFMAKCEDAYRRLGDAIHGVLPPESTVVDLGCGAGYVGLRLEELGHAIGLVDLYGHAVNRRIKRMDVTQRLTLPAADVVICTETAEHIPEAASGMLVENVARNATKLIVWSAAPPGQAGQDADAVGHINEKPAWFWLEQFAALGWVQDEEKTERLQRTMLETRAQHYGCAASFRVLVPA